MELKIGYLSAMHWRSNQVQLCVSIAVTFNDITHCLPTNCVGFRINLMLPLPGLYFRSASKNTKLGPQTSFIMVLNMNNVSTREIVHYMLIATCLGKSNMPFRFYIETYKTGVKMWSIKRHFLWHVEMLMTKKYIIWQVILLFSNLYTI